MELKLLHQFNYSRLNVSDIGNCVGLSNARGGAQSLSSLALSALLDYGDTIDVVAPVDILKQIFKTPYSKARLSVGVHRIGQTLVLCNGYFFDYACTRVV